MTNEQAQFNPKMLAAKVKLLERFRRDGEGFQPATLQTTPAQRAARRVPQGQLDVQWGGVRFADLAALVMPTSKAHFVVQHGAEGYSTNTPLDELMDDDVLLADEFVLELNGKNNGWQPIPTERGGPLRTIVPKLYAWKGSKFLIGLRFQERDEPGFWETRGYHNHADPWRNERYDR